jgi:hypothetical protein
MTEPIEPTPAPPAVEPTPAPLADAPITLPDDHPLVKTLAAQKESLKELREKAKRLDEIEEANKTELQKALDRAEAAEKAASSAESARLRASIAAKHGVPEALLTGSTEEALEEAATALLAFKGTQPTAPSPDGQGNVGVPITGQSKQITSVDELKKLSPEEVNAARRAGRLDQLLGKS